MHVNPLHQVLMPAIVRMHDRPMTWPFCRDDQRSSTSLSPPTVYIYTPCCTRLGITASLRFELRGEKFKYEVTEVRHCRSTGTYGKIELTKKMPESLEGKVVLITGGSSGIGAACARSFASQKCQLVLLARREDRLQEVKAEIQEQFNVCSSMHRYCSSCF